MNTNLAFRKEASPFATIITRLLDESDLYTRAQWAKFLGITTSALSQWVKDKTVPRADLLRMIIDLVRARGGEAGAKITATFDELAQKPAVEVSPLGGRMSPTVKNYLDKSSFVEFGLELRKLPIEDQQRVLTTGSWEIVPHSKPVSITTGSSDAVSTNNRPLGADQKDDEIESELLPSLETKSLKGVGYRRLSWDGLLSHNRCLVIGGPGTGKSCLISALLQRYERSQVSPVSINLGSLGLTEGKMTLRECFNENKLGAPILVDGLDEISSEARKEAVYQILDGAHRISAVKILVASRPVPELELLKEFESFQVSPLTSMQMVLALARSHVGRLNRRASPNEVRRFLCHLSERRPLIHLLSNPLFLKSAWTLFERSAVTPFSEIEVLRECVRIMLEWDDRKNIVRVREPWASSQQLSALLGEISFQLLKRGKHQFASTEASAWIQERFSSVPCEQLLSLLSILGFLQKNEESYSMSHKFLRDFFAAQYVVESSSSAFSYLKEWSRRAEFREVLRLACGITNDATSLLKGVLESENASEADRNLLLAEILAQPVVADQRLVATSRDAIVGWLDATLEDWSIDVHGSSRSEGSEASWELVAKGNPIGKAHQFVRGALTAIHRARSGPAYEPFRHRMGSTKSAVLSAFADSLEVEGRLEIQFASEAKTGTLRAAIVEPRLT